MQNITIARQLARDHEARLRRLTAGSETEARHALRRWIGHALVRSGTRLLGEAPMRTAPAAR